MSVLASSLNYVCHRKDLRSREQPHALRLWSQGFGASHENNYKKRRILYWKDAANLQVRDSGPGRDYPCTFLGQQETSACTSRTKSSSRIARFACVARPRGGTRRNNLHGGGCRRRRQVRACDGWAEGDTGNYPRSATLCRS